MRTIKLGISNVKPDVVLSKARLILNKMTDNPNFPTPNPSLETFSNAINELSKSINEANSGLKVGIINRASKMEKMKSLIRRMAGYVTSVGDGNALILSSSGFELQRERQPMPAVTAPMKFVAVRDVHIGTIKVKWKAVSSALLYQVEVTTGNPTHEDVKWEVVATTSKVRAIVENLKPGTYYKFRVKAIGKKRESPWSDLCIVMAA